MAAFLYSDQSEITLRFACRRTLLAPGGISELWENNVSLLVDTSILRWLRAIQIGLFSGHWKIIELNLSKVLGCGMSVLMFMVER